MPSKTSPGTAKNTNPNLAAFCWCSLIDPMRTSKLKANNAAPSTNNIHTYQAGEGALKKMTALRIPIIIPNIKLTISSPLSACFQVFYHKNYSFGRAAPFCGISHQVFLSSCAASPYPNRSSNQEKYLEREGSLAESGFIILCSAVPSSLFQVQDAKQAPQ